MTFINRLLVLLVISFAITSFVPKEPKPKKKSKPNIILIMADDLGYSDLGSYGSEIRTPNLDSLAFGGIRLQEFYNNGICAPTRASLLTGQYQHKAGVGYFDVNLEIPGYEGYLNKQSVTSAEVLKLAGYNTLMSGKWHVGNDSIQWPNQRGFDDYFGVIGGATDYFETRQWMTSRKDVLVKNNVKLAAQPKDKYFTDEITDQAVAMLQKQKDNKNPFFLYLAYTAPHWPLQAPQEDIARYKGKYDIGWDSLRVLRFQNQKKLGILKSDQKLSQPDSDIPKWDKMTYDEKEYWKRKMEVYAAMVDHMDQGIGRVLSKLREIDKDENTIIIFISDNGAAGEDITKWPFVKVRNEGPVGTSGSFESYNKNWAYASNTPLRSYKSFSFEGGISSPCIIYYPELIKEPSIQKGTGHLIDILPTFIDLANAPYPQNYKNEKINPLPGTSLVPLLSKQEIERSSPIFWERAGNRAVRKGKWKLVSIYPENKWKLFDISEDRAELNDLSGKYPEVVKDLTADYSNWAKETGVQEWDLIKSKVPNY